MKDGVSRLHKNGARARGLTGIQIAVKARKVAAAYVQTNSVALQKDIARGP